MTVEKFLESLENVKQMKSPDGSTLDELMVKIVNIWSESACYGYLILTLQEENYSREEIRQAINTMKRIFEITSVEEAEKAWYEF